MWSEGGLGGGGGVCVCISEEAVSRIALGVASAEQKAKNVSTQFLHGNQ